MDDTRWDVYHRAEGKCETCGATLDVSNFHLAHIIPQRKHWVKKYGKSIIHHRLNFRATCPTDLCNNDASLGNNAYTVEQHAQKIKGVIRDGE